MAEQQSTVDKQVFGMDLKVLGTFAALIFVGASKLNGIEAAIEDLKKSKESIAAVAAQQSKTSVEVLQMQTSLTSIEGRLKKLDETLALYPERFQQLSTEIRDLRSGKAGR